MHCILTQDGNMKSKNKKIYTTPELEFLSNETTLLWPPTSVGVYDEGNEDEKDNLIGKDRKSTV